MEKSWIFRIEMFHKLPCYTVSPVLKWSHKQCGREYRNNGKKGISEMCFSGENILQNFQGLRSEGCRYSSLERVSQAVAEMLRGLRRKLQHISMHIEKVLVLPVVNRKKMEVIFASSVPCWTDYCQFWNQNTQSS